MTSYKLLKHFGLEEEKGENLRKLNDTTLCARYNNELDKVWLSSNYSDLRVKQVCYSNFDFKRIFSNLVSNSDIIVRNIEYDYETPEEVLDDIKEELLKKVNVQDFMDDVSILLNDFIDLDINITKLTVTYNWEKFYIYNNGLVTSVEDNSFWINGRFLLEQGGFVWEE